MRAFELRSSRFWCRGFGLMAGLGLLAALVHGCSESSRAKVGGVGGMVGTAGRGGTAGGDGAVAGAGGGLGGAGGGTVVGNDRSCTTDADCVQCLYISMPSATTQCSAAQGCCGGQAMNVKSCDANRVAWEATCSDGTYPVPICPCFAGCESTVPVSCKAGECGFWCDAGG